MIKKLTFIKLPLITFIFVFFTLACKEEYSSSVYEKNFNSPPSDVLNLKESQVKDVLVLSWQLPQRSDIEYISISANPKEGNLETEKIISKTSSFNVYGLKTTKSYNFKVRTINSKGTYSEGVSVSYRPNINTDLIPYKKDSIALDFGYCKKVTEKTFTYTSTSDENLDFSSVYIEDIYGKEGAFSFNKVSVEELSSGQSTNVTVTYSPSAEHSWDEADLVLCEDPEVKIRLIASNFKQPSDIQKSNLRLWLRPDMISTSDIDSNGNVHRIPDYSGNSFDAMEFDSYVPEYRERVETLNNMPGVLYDGIKRLKASGPIVNAKRANTTFVVIQQTSNASSHYYLMCTNGFSNSFPLFLNAALYFDKEKGYGDKYLCVPGIHGNGITNYRYFFDDSEEDDNIVKVNDFKKPSVICSLMDLEKNESNFFGYLNGEKQLLSYTHSLSSTYGKNYKFHLEPNEKTGLYTNAGYAYGKPWSDGNGKLYKALWNNSLEGNESEKELYYKEHPAEHPTRPDDYAVRWYFLNKVVKNLNSKDFSSSFNNKLSTSKFIMGTIANVYLGANVTNTGTHLHDYIGDVIIYDTALTDEEIKDVSLYLKIRYGITD